MLYILGLKILFLAHPVKICEKIKIFSWHEMRLCQFLEKKPQNPSLPAKLFFFQLSVKFFEYTFAMSYENCVDCFLVIYDIFRFLFGIYFSFEHIFWAAYIGKASFYESKVQNIISKWSTACTQRETWNTEYVSRLRHEQDMRSHYLGIRKNTEYMLISG